MDEISLAPSSNPRLFETNPGGNDSGPDGDGKCLLMPATPVGLPPIPGDGARLGGVERPKPESVSSQQCEYKFMISSFFFRLVCSMNEFFFVKLLNF